MLLFIMRHGEAVRQAETDAARALTAKGREDVITMAQQLTDKLDVVDEIWVSPYTRAQQTADLVSRSLGKNTVTQSFLRPTEKPDQTLLALENSQNSLLLVSHQPLVSILVNNLAGTQPGRYHMSTASIACLKSEVIMPGCAELLWLRQPMV